jgi:hypothetical protein
MSVSVFVRLGVSAGLHLESNTIDTIQKLFETYSVFIYGIRNTPIDYDEHDECFDRGILDVLKGVTSEDEFKDKLRSIAELRMDDNVTCLRRKREYVTPDQDVNYKRYINDDDDNDDNDNPSDQYKPFDLSELWFEFFDHCSSLNADFDDDHRMTYDTVGSTHNFMVRIHESVDYFKSLGIPEEHIDITHYNVLTI